MKKIFWIFTIRNRIKKIIILTVKEQGYFEGAIIKSPISSDELRYLNSRIEMKKEVASILKSLL